MAKKDSAYSLHSCGGPHGGDAGYDPIVETQHAFKGGPSNSSASAWGLHSTASAKAAAAASFSRSAAVVAQRALLASSRRRAGGRRIGVSGTKSMVPSRLSKVSAAAEDVAGG